MAKDNPMVRRPPTYLDVYAAASVASLAVIVAGNWAVDPLHFFHRPFLHRTFVDNQRYQNPGLAKNYEYDAVVIGTSHTENFSPRQIRERFGWKTMPLSISGSTALEQRLILDKAFETGQVRHVLWGLDFTSFHREPEDLRRGTDFPMHLYRETPLTPVKYLLSRDTVKYARDALAGKGKTDLEILHAWTDQYEYSAKRVIESWKFERENPPRNTALVQTDGNRPIGEAMGENIETNLVAVVKAHPDATFHLFFPPYSILAYVNDFAIDKDRFSERLEFKEAVVRELAGCANCRLYDFESAFELTHDLDNYKDLWHYGPHVNALIVDAIARDEYRIDSMNSQSMLAEFDRSVREFVTEAMNPQNRWHDRLGLDASPLHLDDQRVFRVAGESKTER